MITIINYDINDINDNNDNNDDNDQGRYGGLTLNMPPRPYIMLTYLFFSFIIYPFYDNFTMIIMILFRYNGEEQGYPG